MPTASHTIEADPKQIGRLLQETESFDVPMYQRSYSWTASEVDQLWNDLLPVLEGQDSPYFIGSMVFIDKGNSRVEVVDGQQRLATITLLLEVIRRGFESGGDTETAVRVKDRCLVHTPYQGEPVHRVILNEADNAFFAEIISGQYTPEALDRRSRERTQPESHKLIASAYVRLYGLVKEQSKDFTELDQLHNLLKVITEQLTMIRISTTSEDSAYVLFETLNDRGLDLTLGDLLKNYLFSKAGSRLADVQSRWRSIAATIGPKYMTQFLRHEWVSRNGKVRERDLYKLIKNKVRTQAEAVDYVRSLEEGALIYSALKIPSSDYWTGCSNEVRARIETVSELGIVQCYPLLMATCRNRRNELDSILRWIIALTIRYTVIGGKGTGNLETIYANAALKANDTKRGVHEIRGELAGLNPSAQEFKATFWVKRLTDAQTIKYILSQIEQHLPGNEEVQPRRRLTLEHVLPQNPSAAWSDELRTGQVHDDLVDRIGNLTLLTPEDNSKLGNDDFESKRSVFAESSLQITQWIGDKASWGEKEIDDRQVWLADIADAVWVV